MTERGTDTDNNSQEESGMRRLRYQEWLDPCMDFIREHYHVPEEGHTAFRTVIDWFVTEQDITPQIFRANALGVFTEVEKCTKEEFDNKSEQKKAEYVGQFALSINLTNEIAIRKALEGYGALLVKKKKPSNSYLERYKSDKRGRKVAPTKDLSKIGIMTEYDDGHANILLYDDVSITDMFDESADAEGFKYQDDANDDE